MYALEYRSFASGRTVTMIQSGGRGVRQPPTGVLSGSRGTDTLTGTLTKLDWSRYTSW